VFLGLCWQAVNESVGSGALGGLGSHAHVMGLMASSLMCIVTSNWRQALRALFWQ
jgi:hypothetical protein